jgi:hypothetical protein
MSGQNNSSRIGNWYNLKAHLLPLFFLRTILETLLKPRDIHSLDLNFVQLFKWRFTGVSVGLFSNGSCANSHLSIVLKLPLLWDQCTVNQPQEAN